MASIENLLTLARLYMQIEGLEATTVSWRIFGDSKKLTAIENGADIQVRRCERAIGWLSDHWPPAAPWPSYIPRPPAAVPNPAEAQS